METGDRTDGLRTGADGRARCAWAGEGADYVAYHDDEWGRPSADDDRLFEKICLEGFQSGLSWITILRKRENFRQQFAGFSIERVAAMGEGDVERILADPGVVRHRGKIASAINNAKAARRLRDETGASLAAFLWRFEPPAEERPGRMTIDWMRANPQVPASVRMAKALKGRGFTFFGPTTAYAFMQSMGFVNDHLEGCCVREACERARAEFARPS
ncbi:DNA-3-methyladenine glycosylase I [Aureimonas sp. SK2]|uniref:DNA-3-methyladenine glycosylase I n=1 Tax=Aureimonas sp. SK2 TaxID=3015992 RepID=UPI00244489BD|nr:DNA-3-methyladenine glycosylase I [Aureimonas sp. SK2]